MLLLIIDQASQQDLTISAIQQFGFVAIVTVLASFLMSWAVYKYKHGVLEVRVGSLEKNHAKKDEQISALRGDVQTLSNNIKLLIDGKIKTI